MRKTRQSILDDCGREIENINTFYQQPFVNYKGKTSDTDEYFTEVVAEFVCRNIERFQNKIVPITRKSSYKTKSHIGNVPTSNRVEETIAIMMFNQSHKNGCVYQHIGKIIDYQTPLKSSMENKKTGKIDLLSYDEDNRIFHILELKKPDSEETMLRCVLEGYTYLKIIDEDKLIKDFDRTNDKPIIKANPFVFKGKDSNPHKEMQDTTRVWLRKLMALLDSIPYYITEDNGQYFVTDK